jgi:hypothetical protein
MYCHSCGNELSIGAFEIHFGCLPPHGTTESQELTDAQIATNRRGAQILEACLPVLSVSWSGRRDGDPDDAKRIFAEVVYRAGQQQPGPSYSGHLTIYFCSPPCIRGWFNRMVDWLIERSWTSEPGTGLSLINPSDDLDWNCEDDL